MNNYATYQWSMVFASLGRVVAGSIRERDYIAHFGISPLATALLWFYFLFPRIQYYPHISCVHVLWCLWFLKSTPANWAQAGSKFFVDERTFKGHVNDVLNLIETSLPDVLLIFIL